MKTAEDFLKSKGHNDTLYSPTAYVERMMREYAEVYHAEKLAEVTDAELLQDISDRADAVTIYSSDIYLRGFNDGLDYKQP